VLILRHDVFNERSGTVIAVAITSQAQRAGFPLTYELKKNIQFSPSHMLQSLDGKKRGAGGMNPDAQSPQNAVVLSGQLKAQRGAESVARREGVIGAHRDDQIQGILALRDVGVGFEGELQRGRAARLLHGRG